LSVPQPVPVAAVAASAELPADDAETSVARIFPAASASAPGATTLLGPQPIQATTPDTIIPAKARFMLDHF
jgi:hypothetical protein